LAAGRVLAATHPDFGRYHPDGFAATVASLGASYGAIVFAATATGRDLAPRVAAKLGVGLAADAIDLSREGNGVVATRPVYAGKVIQKVRLGASPAVVSVRPNTFQADRRTGGPADGVAVEAVPVPAF